MSLPNGSIANLLVTRKSFFGTQLAMSLSCSLAEGKDKIWGLKRKIKAGACKGAGLGLKNFLAAFSGERIAQ